VIVDVRIMRNCEMVSAGEEVMIFYVTHQWDILYLSHGNVLNVTFCDCYRGSDKTSCIIVLIDVTWIYSWFI
jgi:hypothetical protein